MAGLKNLLLAFTVLSASTAAFACDDMPATLSPGKSAEKARKSHNLSSLKTTHTVSQNGAWSAQLLQSNHPANYSDGYANVSVSHNGIKLRESDFLGRYDLS
ncbi:hypothetical protein [Pseudomonas sp. TMB3-21]